MRTAWIGLVVFLFTGLSLRAGGELEFAVPDQGRITLGVFDSAGKLIRILHRLAREDDFQVGLNGYITTWDGLSDSGQPAPPGHYHVRGYLVGDEVRVSGEDFLFNDWAADSGFPGFKIIRDFSLLENGDLVLLAGKGSGKDLLATFSWDRGFLWSVEVRDASAFPETGITTLAEPAGPIASLLHHFEPMLATNSTEAVVLTRSGIGVHGLEDGREKIFSPRGGKTVPLSLAANDAAIFTSSPDALNETSLPGLMSRNIPSPPGTFSSMDADERLLVGASADGVWIRKETFSQIALPGGVRQISLGMPGTFWFVGRDNNSPIVGQASFTGEVLRVLRPEAGDPVPEKIRAARTSEKFAVIESLPGVQRLRLMVRAGSGVWTIEREKTIEDSSRFGFADGKPAADVKEAAGERGIRVRLRENPLTGKHDFLTVRAASDASGSRLTSPDGLPLVDISSRTDIRRTAITRGEKPGALRLLQGNGEFVEEFSISGLDDILPLDAGGIDLP